MIKRTFISLSLVLQLALPLTAEISVADLDRFITETLTKDEVPGAAVALIQGDRILLLKGYGKREIGKPDPIDENTHFLLASVSKTFTSACVASLVDKKLLDWDREVIQDFPTFVLSDIYATRYSTPRDLLAHRTGLPSFSGDLLGMLGYSDSETVRRFQFIPFNGSFRQKAQYSNVGFFLAGELCSQVAKKSFRELVTDTFFAPMNMSRSGFNTLLKEPNTAAAHAWFGHEIRVIPHGGDDNFYAAGGVVSCAKDIASWVQMFLNEGSFKGKTILSNEAITELFRPAMVATPSFSESPPIPQSPFFAFSLGWDNYEYKGQRVIEKGGALDGTRTVITLLPDLKLGIAVFCNLNLSLFPEKVRTEFLELAVGKSKENFQALIDKDTETIKNLVTAPKPPENAIPLPRPLKSYTGTFESPIYGTFKIEQNGEDLTVLAGPKPFKGRLSHYSNDTFLLSWPVVNMGHQEVTFTFGPKGEVTTISTETLGVFIPQASI